MFDPVLAFQIAAVASAVVVGVVFGTRRAGGYLAKHTEEQMARLSEIQQMRIELLEKDRTDRIRENQELKERVAHLEARVAHLEYELEMEKRITARVHPEAP